MIHAIGDMATNRIMIVLLLSMAISFVVADNLVNDYSEVCNKDPLGGSYIRRNNISFSCHETTDTNLDVDSCQSVNNGNYFLFHCNFINKFFFMLFFHPYFILRF